MNFGTGEDNQAGSEWAGTPDIAVDPVLAETGSKLRAVLEPYLSQGERLLWAAKTTVTDQEDFRRPLTYALTDRRAIMIERDGREVLAAWDKVVRVRMTRYRNGRGRLTLALPSYNGDTNWLFTLKNCPEFVKVQRIVEKLYLGTDSDPASLPELESEVAQPVTSTKEGGISLRWRYRLEAELLPEEQLRWLGKANRREVKKSLNGCLVIGLVPAIGFLVFGLWPFGLIMGLSVGFVALFAYLVLLNTVYAVTNRRVLQVSGLYRYSFGRTIEFYPRLKMVDLQISQDLPDTYAGPRSFNANFVDLIIQEENYPVSRSYRYPGATRRPILFSGIMRKEVEEIKGFIQEVIQRGPLFPERVVPPRRKESSSSDKASFGELNRTPRQKRKRPK